MASQPMTIADVLERAADLIEPEGRWTQDVTARDANGEMRFPRSPDAVCFCALGAIFHEGGERVSADNFFGNFLVSGGDWSWIGDWNDSFERTQPEVVAKLREAAALAREQGK